MILSDTMTMIRRVRLRMLGSARLGLAVITLLSCFACAPDYPELATSPTHAFRIALAQGAAPGDSALCLFSLPDNYDSKQTWPLLVAMHGCGSGAAPYHDLWRETARERGFIIATPQGGEQAAGAYGWCWGRDAEDRVRGSIDHLLHLVNIDTERIYLAGFSQGGGLVYDIGLKYPSVFRGLAPLGARFPSELPGAVSGASERPSQRVYIGRGELEPGWEGAETIVAALTERGCSVEVHRYSGVEHSLPEPATDELARILDFLEARP